MSLVHTITLPHTYRDSVVLMQLSRQLSQQQGVEEAAIMMGTPANLAVLAESDLLAPGMEDVAADDLIMTVRAESQADADAALAWAKASLDSSTTIGGAGGGRQDTEPSVYTGWRDVPSAATIALISTPGPYAAAEAWKALRRGLNVFLFSDHVTLVDEIALKRAGVERGLLVMGPEAGTAIIGGAPLGFANEVRRGPIGVVAASGSGLQEVVTLIDRLGSGISHAIGTGGRDLNAKVGGLTSLQAIDLLAEDEATEVLLMLSKPPDAPAAAAVRDRLVAAGKPAVLCFLGDDASHAGEGYVSAHTLEEAARQAVALTGQTVAPLDEPDTGSLLDGSRLLRGLFSGGTLAYEAMVILEDTVGPVWSNAPLNPNYRLSGTSLPDAHVCLDLGTEEYTTGTPHPMVDMATRTKLIAELSHDPRVGVILLDCVLGYGSHPDPAGALLPAIEQAAQQAQSEGRDLLWIASVTGTERDPQQRSEQVAKLEAGGVLVAPTNASAARIAARLLTSTPERL